MANAFLNAQHVAEVTAKLVGLDLGVAALISRDLEAEFAGRRGATILVPVPGAVPAQVKSIQDKTTPLITNEIAEQSISVTLDDHLYSRVALSEADLDLQLKDFARQVTGPQARALAADIERRTIAALQTTPLNTTIAFDAAAPAKTFTKLRATLRAAKVPDASRLIAVAGLDVEAALLDGPVGTFDADGKVRGFEVHYSNRLAAGEIVAFIPEAFTLVVRAPQKPDGAAFGASVRTESDPSFALRWIRQYSSETAAEDSLVSAFVKVAPMPLPVVNETAGTVSLVANAGAVRVKIDD